MEKLKHAYNLSLAKKFCLKSSAINFKASKINLSLVSSSLLCRVLSNPHSLTSHGHRSELKPLQELIRAAFIPRLPLKMGPSDFSRGTEGAFFHFLELC